MNVARIAAPLSAVISALSSKLVPQLGLEHASNELSPRRTNHTIDINQFQRSVAVTVFVKCVRAR